MIRQRTLLLLPILLAILSCSLFSNDNAKGSKAAFSGETLYLMSASIMAESEQGNSSGGILNKEDRIKIINLGPVVNHEGVDYAPTVSADGRTLYFVSNRPGSRVDDDDNPTHDFWATKKKERLDTNFFEPFNIDTITGLDYLNVNTMHNEGAASIAADRQSLFFTACNRPDGLGDCDLYRSEIQGNVWSRPINLGKNVNSDGWDSQPSIAPDKSRKNFF